MNYLLDYREKTCQSVLPWRSGESPALREVLPEAKRTFPLTDVVEYDNIKSTDTR